MEWIKVENEMPELHTYVWGWNGKSIKCLSVGSKPKGLIDFFGVTHWIYIAKESPKPPQA